MSNIKHKITNGLNKVKNEAIERSTLSMLTSMIRREYYMTRLEEEEFKKIIHNGLVECNYDLRNGVPSEIRFNLKELKARMKRK